MTTPTHYSSLIDAAIHEVLAGNRERFEVVIETYHVQIRSYISVFVRNQYDADDLAQQTFIFALNHLHEFERGTHLQAWLKGIARTHVMSFKKRASQRRESLRTYVEMEIAQRAAEKAPAALDKRLEALEKCFKHLPEHQRNFLQSVSTRSSTLEQLAQELGRTSVSVRRNVSRLYDSLRACIQDRLSQSEAVAP